MDRPLRIGMIGYRFMGRAHANALTRLPIFFPDVPDVELDVLVGRDESALARAADQFGFARTATEWDHIVEDVDVLVNLTPNFLHADPSIAALEAGVHVLCEKPLAHTIENARSMRTAAEQSSALSATAFNYRFLPAIQLAKEYLDRGAIGDIRHVRGRYLQDWLVDPETPWSWRLDADLAGSGALGDLGSHVVDLMRFLIGDIEAVRGHLETFVPQRPDPEGDGRRPVTVDDAFSAQLRFENGAMGVLEASRVATGAKNQFVLTIEGEDGAIRFNLERLNELALLKGDHRGYETILVTNEEDPFLDHWWPPGHVLGWEHTFVHEHAAFLSAIANDEPFEPSFGEGYRVQQVLTAIARSDRDQSWVSVRRSK